MIKISKVIILFLLIPIFSPGQTFQYYYDSLTFYDVKKNPSGTIYSFARGKNSIYTSNFIVKHNQIGEATDFFQMSLTSIPVGWYRNNLIDFFEDSTIISFLYVSISNTAYYTIFRCDTNMNTIWSVIVSGAMNISDIVTHNDKAFIARSTGCAPYNRLGVYCIDKDKAFIWGKDYTYCNINQEVCLIAKKSGNEFVITSADDSQYRCFIKIDDFGNVIWDRVYNFPLGNMETKGFINYQDKYIGIGYFDFDTTNVVTKTPYIMILDDNGNITDFKLYDFYNTDKVSFEDIRIDSNYFYITGSYVDTSLNYFVDYYGSNLFVKTDHSGNIISAKGDNNFPLYTPESFCSLLLDDKIMQCGIRILSVLDTIGNGYCNEMQLTALTYTNNYFEDTTQILNISNYTPIFIDSVVTFPWKKINDSLICMEYPVIKLKNEITDESKAYPNPASEEFFIELTNNNLSTEISYQIFEISGRKVMEGRLDSGKNHITTKSLLSGIYFIEVINGNEKSQFKIVITK